MSIKAVIFDWAGTTVDFGCFAPTGVFIEVFRQMGIDITEREARGPMGLHKRDHIRAITEFPRVKDLWIKNFGIECNEEDIETMFRAFIPLQLTKIEEYSEIVPELHATLKVLNDRNIKIGSTTGYNNKMMEILSKSAARQGYKPDCIVCATDVPSGRPAPWMAFRNAEKMGVYPMASIIKIGDTIADIQEGINAGMWSVGVVNSSNELGMTLEEVSELGKLGPEKLDKMKEIVRDSFLDAGAHYVIDTLDETDDLIAAINKRLERGERP
jgi:phosphonoacetaldehyde hydrolase